LLKAVAFGTAAAIFGAIGTVMVIQAFAGDHVIVYAALAALTLGIAGVAGLRTILAAAGDDESSGT
jgi:hypothetical protein